MGHEETIRIYRSDVAGAEPPSLTYGELAANLADKKVFVGGPGGTADMIVLSEAPDTGVTGMSAGHTGIAVSGTTGFVQIFNMGVLSVDGNTGHISADTIRNIVGPTGDTVQAGQFITIGANKTINNVGVQTFNGLTGAVSITGDGGAIIGASNNIIRVRLADHSTTGVASFNPSFFEVINGAVGLSGVYGTIGVTGLSAGHTGIVLVGTTGNVQIFNMGILSINGQTGHYTLPPVGATGDTVKEGIAIDIIRAGNDVTINNLGVTSFNGLTGAISYAPAIASVGASGVASFLSRDFTVSGTGHVSLLANSIDINSGDGINVVGEGKVELGQGVTIRNTGVTSFNGSTGSISLINFVQGDGIATQAVSNKVVFTNIGVTSLNGLTGARTLTGDGGAIIGAANTQIGARLATTGATGVASFDGNIFTVTAGKVGLTDGGIINRYLVNSNIKITTGIGSGLAGGDFVSLGGDISLVNVGVTGMSAGHTGISLIGTTGNVRIFNMGVLSVDGSTGHIDATRIRQIVGPTGDTVQAGQFITIGTGKTINNVGVQTFNGLTGAVSITGDGGALIGASNNTIRARLADHSTTGVASFLPKFFEVANGAVGLSGVYGTIGVTGLSAGHTGIALVGTTGNVHIFNMGILSINGQTGHYTLPAVGNTGDTVLAGNGIFVSNPSPSVATVTNIGVTSILRDATTITGDIKFNPGRGITFAYGTGGLTFANTGVLTINDQFPVDGNFVIEAATVITGDGGALVGDGVRILARIADHGATGVASFPIEDFGVVNGVVSLTGNVARTNILQTFTASQLFAAGLSGNLTGTATNATQLGGTGANLWALQSWVTSNISQSTQQINQTLLTKANTTGNNASGTWPINITGNAATASIANQVTNSLTIGSGLAGGSYNGSSGVTIVNVGVTSFNGLTGAITLTGDGGAIIGASNNTIRARLATDSLTGVASFPSTFFTVGTNGTVGLSGVYGTIGVTGLSAGHTGISLIGTTGNVRIFNMGVLSVDGSTGHIDATRIRQIVGPTGDTVQAGQFITIDANKTINNVGVQTFNGLTGARTLTGDGGAIIGANNNTIRARLAENGITGVASFPATFFTVGTNGAVGLSGVYGTVGVTGLSAGHTGIALDGTTGNIRIFNMGILSINGQTGHYTLPAVGNTGDTVVPGSGIVIPETSGNTRTIINIGVTGISAGHTGISFSGTTGNIQVFNMGVLSVDGTTGHVSSTRIRQIVGPTGDTVQAGQFITIDANKTINNVGVQTLNGLTGARTLTGDGGAIVGASNNIIRARLAENGVTGVASFSSTNFNVSAAGAVSIKANGVPNTALSFDNITINTFEGSGLAGGGNVALGGTLTLSNAGVTSAVAGSGIRLNKGTGEVIITNIGVTGISAGHTGIALDGTTGNVRIFNMGILSINGQTGHYTLPAAGATGDTVVAGVGISATRSGGTNVVTINNMGVTSFNGLTGAVTYSPPFATLTATGVASFNSTYFTVTDGAVSLASAYQATGDTVQAGQFITIGTGKTINNVGVQTFNGLTGAVSMTGDNGAIIGASNNTIRARLATDSLTGVASFPATFFTVGTNGAVGLSGVYGTIGVTGLSAGHTGIALVGTTGNVRIFNMGVHTFNGQTGHITFSVGETGNTVVAGSGIVIPTSSDNTKTIINVGVTGIGFGNDAGLTGKINLTASGNITMVRSGNLITVGSDFSIGATGDTVVAGVGISAVKSGVTNVVTINNMGVTSFNGLTGAVSMTGDGGAIIGASNNTIRARLADYSVTGVASFFSSDFVVSTTGHVSLTGNVARTNISNTFNAFQFFPQGFNTARGVTFGSTTEPVNMSQNLNVAGNISAENLQSWIVSSSDRPLSPNRGVFANKSSGQLLLDIDINSSSYGVGSTVEVSGLTGSWRIKVPNNHKVHFGNVTVAGTGFSFGFLESTHHRDSIRMVCCSRSTSPEASEWNVLSSVGSINYGTDF